MIELIERYPRVLKPFRYQSREEVLDLLSEEVIGPAEAKVKELRGSK